ncbi:MAG TPA: HAMP domain-containing sensor histidine kinase [Longimicrobiaceae bacterium]|nr:HAMP domain-containing sensor histidine kinase [Longimicrobiaceae bacterium]
MRIATRLVLSSVAAVVVVMTAYGLLSLRQRGFLISDALVRETETLAHAMQIVANNAIRDDQIANLDLVLERLSEDQEMYISALISRDGEILAGGPAEAVRCVLPLLPLTTSVAQELQVWTECEDRIRLIVLPVLPPAHALIIARRTTVVERDTATSQRRILITTLILATLAALAIIVVLRRTLSRPLAQIMKSVHLMGGPAPPPRVPVPKSGELAELAEAFNEMIARLEGKRQSLIVETEERIELERRLRRAETFAALGRLTGGLAHELGSPLNVIGVRAEAIQADPAASAGIRRQAEEIVGEMDRMTNLVKDLVHVARRHSIVRLPIDLTSLVRSVVADFRAHAADAGINIETEYDDVPARIRGDEALIKHALSNILMNAIQALESGGSQRRLSIIVETAGKHARITVRDFGPGIDAEVWPHLFEPFFTTKDVGEGMGLGLAITLGIVEEHGGTVTIENCAEGGVTAVIELPMHADEPEAIDE